MNKQVKILFIFFLLISSTLFSQKIIFHIQSPFGKNEKITLSEFDWIMEKIKVLHRQDFDSLGRAEFLFNVGYPRKIVLGNNEIFIEPEKEVFLTLDSNFVIMKVQAAYPANYTMYQKLHSSSTRQEDSAISAFPEKIKERYKNLFLQQIAIADSAKKQNLISPRFYTFLTTECNSRYLSGLYYYYTARKDVVSTPASFLEEFSKDKFEDETNLNSMFYSFALYNYVSYISQGNDGTIAAFDRILQTINNGFNGSQKEFLLTYLFRRYCKLQKSEYNKILPQAYYDLMETVKTPKYKESIQYNYQYYLKANRPVPDSVAILPLTMKNAESSLKEVLNKGNSTKIILFWASWCGPCISEIRELKEKFPDLKSSRFDFVFISADEDDLKFKAAAGKLGIQSFRLNKSLAVYSSFFKLSALPRHLLIKNGQIEDLNFDLKIIY